MTTLPFHGEDDLRRLIREEVAAGIKTASEEECTRPCGRVRSLQRINWAVFVAVLGMAATYIGSHL